jgi:hypothetical protein
MVGLGLITLATVTNFALAGMTAQELDAMPAFLAVPYEMGGRLGVTLILVALGLLVMAGGHAYYYLQKRFHRPDPWGNQFQQYSTAFMPLPSRGAVRLETAKYLTPPGPMVFAEASRTEAAGVEGHAV